MQLLHQEKNIVEYAELYSEKLGYHKILNNTKNTYLYIKEDPLYHIAEELNIEIKEYNFDKDDFIIYDDKNKKGTIFTFGIGHFKERFSLAQGLAVILLIIEQLVQSKETKKTNFSLKRNEVENNRLLWELKWFSTTFLIPKDKLLDSINKDHNLKMKFSLNQNMIESRLSILRSINELVKMEDLEIGMYDVEFKNGETKKSYYW